MTNCLRTFLSAVLCAVAIGSWAQAPQSGTYRIKGTNGKYVELKGKYYAKPDAAKATDYTTIGVGVGYNTGDGYRVYSLTGKNPTDGSPIEVYDYINKACNIVSKLAQEKINGKLESLLSQMAGDGEDGSTGIEIDEEGKKQLVEAIDAMADSICRIYTDDYAYMTLVPVGHYGSQWVVRAKATVPTIPYTIQAVGNHFVKGHVVYGDHQCTDVWDWAKQHVLKYLAEHQTNTQLQVLVKKYLDDVEPGTTYYLTCEDNETFGYATTPTDNGLWTMEAVETAADGLATGTYNIKNNSTNYYVNVTGKYKAEPELTLDDIKGSTTNKQNAAIALDFGRYDKGNANLYRITELSNQGRDVVSYIAKGMAKAFGIVDKKMAASNYYTKLAEVLNSLTGEEDEANKVTAAQVEADAKTALDLCAQHYAYMSLQDNGDQTVSLFVDVPAVPAMLEYAAQLKGREESESVTFETLVKEQLDKYFNDNTTDTDAYLRQLWRQNRDKWGFGKRYYLSAEAAQKTFEFTTDATEATTKWTLADVQAEGSTTNPGKGYFRVKNEGGYKADANADNQQYIEVRGRATADVATTNAEKFTKVGSVIYLNLDNNATDIMAVSDPTSTVKAYEVLNLRSQGIDVLGGAESTMDELAKMFGSESTDEDGDNASSDSSSEGISLDVTPAYNGYIGFARYMLAALATLGESSIAGHATDWWEIPEGKKQGTDDDVKKCTAVLDDFVKNYLPELKLQVYLIPVEGKANTYYIRSKVPSLAPIANFYKTHKEDMDSLVIPCVDRFLRYDGHYQMLEKAGFTGEYFTIEDERTVLGWNGSTFGLRDYAEKTASGQHQMYTAEEKEVDNGNGTKVKIRSYKEDANGKYYRVAYSTILNDEWLMFNWLKLQAWHALEKMGYDAKSSLGGYLGMIHYDVPYFLIQGDNHDANGNRTYVGNTSLGFANDGAVHDTYNDLANAGEHAQWTLEPVDTDNYFAVKPNTNAAPNGKYFASTYLDFPFEAKGSNVTAVYTLSSDGVQNGTEQQTAEDGTVKEVNYQYVTFNKCTGTVPAATPAIIEYSATTVDGDIALVPVVSDERGTKNSLIQGTFFGGYYNVTEQTTDESGTMATLKALLKSIKDGSIQSKYGVDTDGKDLYLWGYNKKDTRNPYGFYLYSKATDTEAKWNIIPGNKPFLIQDPESESNAKVYVQFDDNELTGIEAIFGNDTQAAGTAERYNLAGQRVNEAYKGVVIVNGQKYIQK